MGPAIGVSVQALQRVRGPVADRDMPVGTHLATRAHAVAHLDVGEGLHARAGQRFIRAGISTVTGPDAVSTCMVALPS